MPFLTGEDSLARGGVCHPHRLPLRKAPVAYQMFQQKADGADKIMLEPWVA